MVRIVAMVLFGLPVTFAIAMEKTVTSFLPFRLPCFCVLDSSRYRVASMGEIRETMLMVNKEAQQNRTRTVSPAAIPSKANYRVKSKKHL